MAKLTEENWEYLSNFERAKYVMRNDDENFCLLLAFIFLVAGFFSQGAASLAWFFLTILAIIAYSIIYSLQAKTVNLAEDRLIQTVWNERKKKR